MCWSSCPAKERTEQTVHLLASSWLKAKYYTGLFLPCGTVPPCIMYKKRLIICVSKSCSRGCTDLPSGICAHLSDVKHQPVPVTDIMTCTCLRWCCAMQYRTCGKYSEQHTDLQTTRMRRCDFESYIYTIMLVAKLHSVCIECFRCSGDMSRVLGSFRVSRDLAHNNTQQVLWYHYLAVHQAAKVNKNSDNVFGYDCQICSMQSVDCTFGCCQWQPKHSTQVHTAPLMSRAEQKQSIS